MPGDPYLDELTAREGGGTAVADDPYLAELNQREGAQPEVTPPDMDFIASVAAKGPVDALSRFPSGRPMPMAPDEDITKAYIAKQKEQEQFARDTASQEDEFSRIAHGSPFAGMAGPFVEYAKGEDRGIDQFGKALVNTVGATLALPFSAAVGAVPGGVGTTLVGAAMEPIHAAGKSVVEMTGSEAAGAVTENVLPIALGAAGIKGMKRVGEMRAIKPDVAALAERAPAPVVRADVASPLEAPTAPAPVVGPSAAGRLAAMAQPTGIEARLARAGLDLPRAVDAAVRNRPGELDMLRPADRAYVESLATERARAASFPKKPEMMQAFKEKLTPPEPKVGGFKPVESDPYIAELAKREPAGSVPATKVGNPPEIVTSESISTNPTTQGALPPGFDPFVRGKSTIDTIGRNRALNDALRSAGWTPEELAGTANEPRYRWTRPTSKPVPIEPETPSAPSAEAQGAPATAQAAGSKGPSVIGRPASTEAGAVGPFAPAPKSTRTGMSPQTSAAFDSVRERILPEKPKPTLKERAVAAGNSLRDFYRQQAPIADFERATAGKLSDRGPTAYAEYAQGSSGRITQTGWEEGVIESRPVKSVKDALDKVPQNERADLSAYLVARQELAGYERLPSTAHQGPAMRESGFDTAKIREVVKAGDAKPEWAAARDALRDQFKRSLDDMLDSGAISKATHDRITAADPKGDYFGPWERVLPKSIEDSVAGGSLKPGERQMFGRVGGTQPILDPLPRAFEALRRRRALINDARVGQKLLEWHDQNPQGATPFMREINNPSGRMPGTGPQGVARLDFDAFVQKWEAEHPGVRDMTKLDHGLDAALSKWAEEYAKMADEGVLAVRQGGKTRFFELPDKRFARTIFGLDAEHALAASKLYQAVTKPLAVASRIQRLGITGINPDFIASQVTKDPRSFLFNTTIPWQKSPSAFIRATVGLGEHYVKSMYGGAARTRLGKRIGMSEPKDVVAYRQAGAEGYYDTTRPKGPVEGAASKAVESTLGNVEGAMGTIESGPRQLEYAETMKRFGRKPGAQNVPLDELVAASNAAAKVTTSFKLGSKASKEVAKIYPYFSARLQGVATVLETMKRDPKTAAIRIAVISTIPRIALWLKNKDDEAYKDAPTWRKYGGWEIIPGKLWLPGVSIIDTPGVAIEAMLNKIYAQDPHAAEGLAKQLVEDFSPIGDPSEPVNYAPGAMKGPLEVKIGQDTFTKADINPKGMENVERIAPDLVARETTSKTSQEFAKNMHEWLGSEMTAAEIDHLFFSYTGGTGKRLMRMNTAGPKETADTMILGRFVPRIKESQTIRDYYDNRGLASGANRAAKLAAEAGDDERAEKLGVGRGSFGPEARLRRVDEALADASDRYNAAEEKDRDPIAREMVETARAGLEILRAAGLTK